MTAKRAVQAILLFLLGETSPFRGLVMTNRHLLTVCPTSYPISGVSGVHLEGKKAGFVVSPEGFR